MPIPDQEVLLDIIRKLQNGEGDDEEAANWIDTLERNVPHTAISDLIFYDELSAEEILARALSYAPISV